MSTLPRIVVLVSGSGTNLQALIDAAGDGRLRGQIVAVVCNRRKARALERAEAAEISTVYVPFRPYRLAGKSREDYDGDLADLVEQLGPDLIVCAGWMHIFSSAFVGRFPDRIINLHPALPGQFPGAHAIKDAHEAFERGEITHTGIMIHQVVPEVDAGPVVATAEVPIQPGDSLETLEAHVHAAEHRLIVETVDQLCCALNDPTTH